MAPSTPNVQLSGPETGDFTRPQEPHSPTNFNKHASKRQQRTPNVTAPPRLDYGGGVNTCDTASKAITSHIDAYEREARIQRTVMNSFANAVDNFVTAYNNPDERLFAQSMCEKVVHYLTNALFAESNNHVPIRIQKYPVTSSAPSASSKSVTWAGVASTLKNSGADIRPTKSTSSSSSGSRASTAISGGVSLRSGRSRNTTPANAGQNKPKKDRRLLIPVEHQALLNRPEPFALRQELCASVPGLTLASVPHITPTRTGWALTPSSLGIRDILTSQAGKDAITKIFQATAVIQPQVWHNYAVPGVPSTMQQLVGGANIHTGELIEEEVVAQTNQKPISCRPSRHGPNPKTGKTTWIISFLAPVRPFRLFNASDFSKHIDKKPTIGRHDPGCQGWCNPSSCTRYPRCNNCGTRTDQHDGPSGVNCTQASKCANCHGPFPAGHNQCPAAPQRRDGKIIKPAKKELDTIRRHGDRVFTDYYKTSEPAATLEQTQPQLPVQDQGNNATSRGRKRKGGATVTDYERQGSQTPAAASTPPPTSSPSSPPPTAPSASRSQTQSQRARRATILKNMNEGDLFSESLGGMDIDTPDFQC